MFAIFILAATCCVLTAWLYHIQSGLIELKTRIVEDGLNAGLLADLHRKLTGKIEKQAREFERGIFSAVYDKPRHEMNELRFRIGELESVVKSLLSPPIKGLRRVPAKVGMVIDFEGNLLVYDGVKWREASEQEKAQVNRV